MADDEMDTISKVELYRDIVLTYEKINSQIADLFTSYGSDPAEMSAEDRARYRRLARERDDLQNQMRYLESQLLDEDE